MNLFTLLSSKTTSTAIMAIQLITQGFQDDGDSWVELAYDNVPAKLKGTSKKEDWIDAFRKGDAFIKSIRKILGK